MKNGKISLGGFKVGHYHRAVLRYVREELKRENNIQKDRIFITHTGCPVRFINEVKEEVAAHGPFEKVIVTKASATISCNCGVETLGVLYQMKE